MSETTARKSSWIPWVFVGFFGVVFVANAIMIWLALTTFTGLDRDEPYVRGVGYNDVLAEERRQEALGWTAAVSADADGLAVALADRLDQPLGGATVYADLDRPVDSAFDFRVALEPAGAGRYAAAVDWPAPGRWDVLVTVERDGDVFQHHRRLMVR